MSGFGDSLRAWANIGGDPDPPQEEPSVPTPQTPSDPDEIRRKRLARMAGSNSSNSPRQSSAPTQMETTPVSNTGPRGRLDFTSPDLDMEVANDNDNDNVNDNDEDLDNEGGVTPMDLSTSQDDMQMSKTTALPATPTPAAHQQTHTQKQLMSQTLDPAALRASTAPPFTSDRPPTLLSDHPSPRKTKRLRKRDATMIKVLSITTLQSDQTDLLTYIKFGEGESQPAIIPVDSLDSLIAGRLNVQSSALKRDKSAIAYLTNLHERARMELSKVSEEKEDDLTTKTMLMDAKKCAATYAVSCLLYEELFASSHHSKDELVKCLLSNTAQICNHAEGSFLSDVVKELINQEELENVVGPVVDKLMENFGGGSLLEEKAAKSSNSSRALQSLLNIKAVAVATSSFPNFNLPSSSSPVAKEVVQPSMDGFDTQQQQFMAMMLRMQNNRSAPGAYLRRSGPALETSTILGRLLSLGLPTRDPKVTSQFANAARRTMQDVNNVKEGLRKTNMVHLELSTQIVKALLKGGKESRNGALAWFKDSLIVNCRAGGDVNYRDASKNSSTHTMLNIATVLLKLSGPFVGSEEKRKLIDPSFVWSEEAHGGVYASSGDEKVDRLNCDTPTPKNVDPNQPAKDFNFITNCFFLTARALNLGLFPLTSTYHSLGRQLGHMNWQIRSRGGDAASDPNFNRALSMHMAHEVVAADPELIRDAVKFYDVLAEMMCSLDTDTVQAMPEFFVDDVCSILNFAATERGVPSDVLKGVSVANIFNLVIRLLSPAHAKTIKNYNLRARLGDILFHIFLPSECKREEDEPQYGEDVPASVCCDPKTGQPFLLSSKEAQDTLAPSLLLLYGEVEHTGPYEKQGFRSRICSLLKYLWNSPQHHNAFAKIAQDEVSFVKFANGVLNETNELIVVMMEKLPQIKQIQDEMKLPEWGTRTQEAQDEVTGRLSEHEQQVKSSLMLCNKTMKMFAFLSTDEKIANLFQGQELSQRLVNVLLYVVQNMLGTKGLDLKVDNPESYYFKPRELLSDLIAILCCFVDSSTIHNAIANSGYYNEKLLPKLLKTAGKLKILKDGDDRLAKIMKSVETAKDSAEDLEELLKDAPDEYLDPLTYEVMMDPVVLTTSDTIVERSTITQHLLNDPTDPFNRQPLTMAKVKDAVELKAKIEEWIEERREEAAALKMSMETS